MDVYVGDKVQIINGGIDVTNGVKAKAGRYYGENGPLWATVQSIDPTWNTGGQFGLAKTVVKVRCVADNGVVVWQVRPEDISPNIIRASKPEIVQKEPEEPKPTIPTTDQGLEDFGIKRIDTSNLLSNGKPYVILAGQNSWGEGVTPSSETTGTLPDTIGVKTKYVGDGGISLTVPGNITYERTGSGNLRPLNDRERKSIGSNNVEIDDSVMSAKQKTAWQDQSKRRQMLNSDIENIQNSESFPVMIKPASGLKVAKYDYKIIPGDQRLKSINTLEDELMKARAAFGIPVHGSNSIARAVKYYMYNRFKVPDTNLAHNKSVTHVFFTRPDLNLLIPANHPYPNSQVLNHSESALIWRKNPELFKLLTDYRRCGDSNNFNILLSNQVTSFDIRDEEISTVRAGKSWNDYEMVYGDAYTGRAAGEFTCNFNETSDYSIINLIKLWITYIDNVARGAWSPSYELGAGMTGINKSHVFTKTLDYASSVYVFKCGPDGEDVLYWSKYYGVFPVNTGASALSWDNSGPIGDTPKLNIRFNYSFKKDLSPISLIEFNNISGISSDTAISESSFNGEYGHSSRPFVGAPFIEMNINNSMDMNGIGVNYNRGTSSIRLKFRKTSDSKLTDEILYRSSLDGRKI